MLNRLLSKLPHNAYNQRWGVMAKMVLQWPTGEIYLRRWRLVQTPFFGLYIHKIERGDYDNAMHDHPWRATKRSSFYSFILRGGYTERFAEDSSTSYFDTEIRQTHVAPTLRSFPNNAVHQIVAVLPNTWTLLIVGRRVSSWSFYDPATERLVPWMDYLESVGRGPMGNRLPVDDVPDA